MTTTWTTIDLVNATKYATELFVNNEIIKYFNDLNIQLDVEHLEWPFEMTKNLKDKIEPRIKYKFGKSSCEKLKCFEYNKYGKCQSFNTVTVKDPSNTYEACQPICEKMNVPVDTIWQNDECKLVNMALKRWCLIPSTRQETRSIFNKTPPFFWDNQICKNSKEYCTYFDLTIDDKNECIESDLIKGSRFIFGKTLTHLFGNAIYFPPNGLINWKPPSFSQPKKLDFNVKEFSKTDDDEEFYKFGNVSSRVLVEVGKLILEYLAIDYSIKGVVASVTQIYSMLPAITIDTAAFESSTIVSVVVNFLTTNDYLLAAIGYLSVGFDVLMSILNPALLLFAGINITGLILDQIDPLHLHSDYKYYISNSNLKQINKILNDKYSYILSGKGEFDGLIELLPAIVWGANVKLNNDVEKTKFIMEKSAHYLTSLKYNSDGQELIFEEKVQKVNIVIEPHVNNVDLNNFFDPPSPTVKISLLANSCIILFSYILYMKFFNIIFLFVMLIAICCFSFSILFWWTSKYKIENYIYNNLF